MEVVISTTAIFAEILITGIGASAWLLLLLASLYKLPVAYLEKFKDWEALTTVVVLAVAYVLGILVDRVADSFNDRLWKTQAGRKLQMIFRSRDRKTLPELPAGTSIMRLRVLRMEDGVANFLEYQRSRLRIARSSVVNLAFLLPASGVFILLRTNLDVRDLLVAEAVILVLWVTCLFASVRIEEAYIARLIDAYNMAVANDATAQARGNERTK